MSFSPHPRFPIEAGPSSAPIRFECVCKLDARGAAFLELSGELDLAVCDEFEARLAEAQRASSTVALDLRRLTFMDGAGYKVLDRAAEASQPEARISLTGCAGQVGRLLDIVGLPEKVEMQRSPQLSAAASARSSATNRSEASIGA